MKQCLSILLSVLLLAGCSGNVVAEVTVPETTAAPTETAPLSFQGTMAQPEDAGSPYVSRFDSETTITLSDTGIRVDGNDQAVFTSHDILYYQDRDCYESGNPYGEGTAQERHSAGEAAAHTVVNITAPGAYRVTGTLSAGQLRIDLGETAYYDPDAVVELILDDAHICCTVAPAILFLNTYECDGNWSTETAVSTVDTSAAGANLILEGSNTVTGSHVARIYKDTDEEKKLWKQDGAIYSYMSANVYGPGALVLTADNEGLDTELHLTIHGGDIAIRAGNDGINTNEDGVSVTTVNGGRLHIVAGLGEEGDGIDSNGYLVINGGTVVAAANPAADAGMDADLGSFINGGTVIALGSTMDWAESDSAQVTMNLQFARHRDGGSAIVAAKEDGTVVFAYDPSEDELLGSNARQYQGAVISCPGFALGEAYHIFLGGTVTGQETGGVYSAVTAYENGQQMGYGGTALGMGGMTPPEGMELPEGMEPGQRPEGAPFAPGETMPEKSAPGQREPGAFGGQAPDAIPEEKMVQPGEMTPPDREGFAPGGQGGSNGSGDGLSRSFPMTDKVNAFSGVTEA